MDNNFFTQKYCSRCSKELTVRIMSMFDTKAICMECKKKETKHPDYKKAVEAELREIKKGNYNYQGIRQED